MLPSDFIILLLMEVSVKSGEGQPLSTLSLSKVTRVEGLDQHEIVALAALAENIDSPEDHASAYMIRRDMEVNGFTKAATTFALRSLLQKGLLHHEAYPGEGFNESYIGYMITENGWEWISANMDKFALRTQPTQAKLRDRF